GLAHAFSDPLLRREGVVVPIDPAVRPPMALIDPIATPGITSVIEQGAPMIVGAVTPAGGDRAENLGARSRPSTIGMTREGVAAAPRLDAYSHRLVVSPALYDGGTTNRTSRSLAPLATTPSLSVNPADLAPLGVAEGDRLRVWSAKGTLEIAVHGDDG